MDTLYKGMKKVIKLNWKDCLKFSSKQSLHPDMLTNEGYQTIKYLKLSKYDKPILVMIDFDKEYVIYYLNQKVINRLCLSKNQFYKLIKKCMAQNQYELKLME